MAVAAIISTPLSVGPGAVHVRDRAGLGEPDHQPAMEVFVGIPSVVWGWLGITILVPFLRDNFGCLGFTVGLQLVRRLAGPVAHDPAHDHDDLLRRLPRRAGASCAPARSPSARPAGRRSATSSCRRPDRASLTAVVLGLMRAAGEALAVQMVIGNRPDAHGLTQPITTLTSQITLDMGNTVFGEPWNKCSGRWAWSSI